jgi:hypothetical protein
MGKDSRTVESRGSRQARSPVGGSSSKNRGGSKGALGAFSSGAQQESGLISSTILAQ